MAKKSRIALGFRAHSGWAAVVAIGGSRDAPVVLMRTRIELADPEIPESIQPYHSASELDIAAAGIFSIRYAPPPPSRWLLKAMHRHRRAIAKKSGHEVVACGNLPVPVHSLRPRSRQRLRHILCCTPQRAFNLYRNRASTTRVATSRFESCRRPRKGRSSNWIGHVRHRVRAKLQKRIVDRPWQTFRVAVASR